MPLNNENVEALKISQNFIASNNFQLDPSQVEFKNPKWVDSIQALAQRALKEMGYVDREVTAKLNSILIQTKGLF